MFSFTFGVCKQLARPKSFRLLCISASVKKNKPQSQPELNYEKFDLTEIVKSNPAETSRTLLYLKNVKNNENIDWKSLITKLNDANIRSPTTNILKACLRLGDVSLAEKYYSYLTETGYQLTVFDKIYFCKLLCKEQQDLIPKYEEIFISLYEQIKPILKSSSLLQKYLYGLFIHVPHLYDSLTENKTSLYPSSIVIKAAELQDIDKAFELINNNTTLFGNIFLEKCAKACLENAKDGKFSIDFINKLVKFCSDNSTTVNKGDCFETLISLFKNLNLHGSNYHWSVKTCTVNNNICSNCHLALKPNTLSEEEFVEMRTEFFNNIILKDPFIHSTESEIQKYLTFLKHSKPYDVVIDALNLLYLKKVTGVEMVQHYMSHFLDLGHSIMIVSRKHMKSKLLKPAFVKYEKYKSRIQYFFTENLSSDDIFILYAALYSGPNTVVITGDLLRNFSGRLSRKNMQRFKKWQMSNQYCTDFHLDLAKPVAHCGLPQLTHTPTKQDEKYVWHLSYQNKEKLSRQVPIEWICVTATKIK